MPEFRPVEVHVSKRVHFASEAPIVISQDDAPQSPAGHRMLFVLGLGIAGAIFADAVVFTYFAVFYAFR